MKTYEERLKQAKCCTVDDVISMCRSFVPVEHQRCPWNNVELNHGINLLQSDVALDCYMAAYGEMHRIKCQAALQNFPFHQINGAIEIVDWGCGQGIGTLCMLEALQQRYLGNWLKKITLIDPSVNALNRAEANVLFLTGMGVETYCINKYLPCKEANHQGLELDNISYRYSNVIHIFSNILDVKEIDLEKLAKMVGVSKGNQFVLCVGPKNSASYRMEQFCSIFGNQTLFSNVNASLYAQTSSGHSFTCMTRGFLYDGSPLQYSNINEYSENDMPVYSEYDLRLKIENNLLSLAQARVAFRLEQILTNDDILFFNTPINECFVDFVVVRRNVGILLINVFDKDLSFYKKKVVEREYEKNGKTIKEVDTLPGILVEKESGHEILSPLNQIKSCQSSVREGFEEILMSTIQDIRNLSLIKMAVVFPNNTQSEIDSFFTVRDKYTFIFDKDFIKSKEDTNRCFNSIHFSYKNHNFDEHVFHRIIRLLSPQWHSRKEGRGGIELSTVQKRLAVSNETRQKISGVAGSGKTQVLVQRAVNAQKRTGGDILVLTYNITLANYLRYRFNELCEDFPWNKFHIYHYHHFFRLLANKCHLQVDFSSYEDETFFDNSKDDIIKYSAIFIDEIQDYETTWLKIIDKNFLEEHGELVVFGDPKQNIYHRKLDKNKDIRIGVIGGSWNKELKENKRFTNPLLSSLSVSFQRVFQKEQNEDEMYVQCNMNNQFNFNVVSYIDLRDKHAQLEDVAQKCLKIVEETGLPMSDCVILSSSVIYLRALDSVLRKLTNMPTTTSFIKDEQYRNLLRLHHATSENAFADWKFKRDYEALDRMKKYKFSTDNSLLKLSTIQSFKGWESPVVILLLEGNIPHSNNYDPLSPEVIYTGITRARAHLSVINLGCNIYHDFFSKI